MKLFAWQIYLPNWSYLSKVICCVEKNTPFELVKLDMLKIKKTNRKILKQSFIGSKKCT